MDIINDMTTLEKVKDLYKMLQGDAPDGYSVAGQPKLSSKEAFSVIWFIQEHLRIIPDSIEACSNCGELFCSHSSGHIISDDHENDSWYSDCGFTPEDISPHEGKAFCDNSCEIQFLRNS